MIKLVLLNASEKYNLIALLCHPNHIPKTEDALTPFFLMWS